MARPRKNELKDIKKPPLKPSINIICTNCGKEKKTSEFYASYTSEIKVTPYCKECIQNKSIDENGNIDKQKFIEVLRTINRPFMNQIYNNNFEKYKNGGTVSGFVGWYMKDIATKQYREFTFDDSDMGVVNENTNNSDAKIEEKPRQIKTKAVKLDKASRESLIDKWGKFEDETLNRFEKKFNQLAKNYEIITSLHMEALINYTKFSVLQDIAIENDNTQTAKMYGDLATKARTDAKLNPSQLSKSDLNTGVASFSEVSQLVAQRDGLIRLPTKYLKKPHDQLDVLMWENLNFNRALFSMPEVSYEEMYGYYIQRLEKFNEKYNADLDNGDLGTWLDN
nr:MAG TPA: Stc1 domain [Caudoviricetes sp.]